MMNRSSATMDYTISEIFDTHGGNKCISINNYNFSKFKGFICDAKLVFGDVTFSYCPKLFKFVKS